MRSYPFLFIGGGMTAAAAAQGIREAGEQGEIGMISMDQYAPYKRPPLSKKLWVGKPESIIWLDQPAGVDLLLNRQVVAIDPQNRRVRVASGEEIGYERLLLATGGTPRRLPFGGEDILYYRTLADYHKLRSLTGQGRRFGVIGNGFIGSEIAAALCMNGEQVVLAIPHSAIGARIYPQDLADYVTEYYRKKGVDVRAGTRIRGVERRNGDGKPSSGAAGRGGRLAMQSGNGDEIVVDTIVAGIGIQPNTALAQSIGLKIDAAELEVPAEQEVPGTGGIWVDENLRTSHPDIWAAGDAAAFYNPQLGKRIRVEHADNATAMGRVAGLNLAGRATPYDYLPFFYSDLFDLGYEAVGELDSRLETFADWKEPFRQGVVYYLDQGRVRGVLLWDTWDQVDAARRLIAEGRTYKQGELKGRLPE